MPTTHTPECDQRRTAGRTADPYCAGLHVVGGSPLLGIYADVDEALTTLGITCTSAQRAGLVAMLKIMGYSK